jgi:predicted metal-dependent peptidase
MTTIATTIDRHPREATPEILEKAADALSRAKIHLMSKPNSAFYTTLLFSLCTEWDCSVPTAATDGRRIYINPYEFLVWTAEERVGVLLHEALHVGYLHLPRKGDRHHRRWNYAGDYVINLVLKDNGYSLPHYALYDEQYRNRCAEEIYGLLEEPAAGSSLLDDLRPSEDNTPIEDIEQEITDILVRAKIQSEMAGDKPGVIPGDIQIFLKQLLEPKLPWQRLLQKYIQSYIQDNYTFAKLRRRYLPNLMLPSLYSRSLMEMALFVDTSGSISDEQFRHFISETHGLLRMMKPAKLFFGQFDTTIKRVDEIKTVRDLAGVEFSGRGGTNIVPVLKWAQERKPRLLVIFTDGCFPPPSMHCWPDKKTDTLWVVYDNPSWKPLFGDLIHYHY